MARETIAQIMKGVDFVHKKKIANNTVEYLRENGEKVIRLHHTDIITFKVNGDIVLNSGGWQSATTKERMNEYLPNGFYIYQEKSVWYLDKRGYKTKREGGYIFQDGITIKANGKVTGQRKGVKKLKNLDKKISKYAKDFVEKLKQGKIPLPSAGDCLYCCNEKGSMGDLSKNKEHLLSHIKEKYYVPSLMWRAMDEFGASSMMSHIAHEASKGKIEHIEHYDFVFQQIEKCIKRYLRRRLGFAA